MKDGLRQSMAWLHTWSGLLFGWLLFAIFATGTSAYFQEEITAWMQPEVHAQGASQEQAVEAAARWLEREVPGAHVWSISPPGKRSAVTRLFWEMEEDIVLPPGTVTEATLDAAGNKVTARETRGGLFLYDFHFRLHYMDPITGQWIVGIAAMFMLVGLISGIVTHKKIFADFFLLRLGKGQRSWLDAHNVTGVLVLPFCLMITYTGLVTLGGQYMPWGVAANYASEDAYLDDALPHYHAPERSGVSAELAPIGAMMATARDSFGGQEIGTVTISNPGDTTATVEVFASNGDQMSIDVPGLLFNGATGELMRGPVDLGGGTRTEGVMFGLHMGRYAGALLRWLYFLSGVAGTAMIATGLVLWTVKRRAKLPDPANPHFGFRLVAKLNIAAIAGLPIGIAAYFHANRLLPTGLPQRSDWEINAMFVAWGAAAVWAFARPERRSWIELLWAAALLLALVPAVSALTTDRSLAASIGAGDVVYIGFELVVLALAACLALAARYASRQGPKAGAEAGAA